MKTKSLFIIALLSLFSLSAFAIAVTDTCYVEIDYPSDSLYHQGDTVNFTLQSTMTLDTVIVRLLSTAWSPVGTSINLDASLTLPLDTFLIVPEDTKMKDCPAEGDNPFSLMLQVGPNSTWNGGPIHLTVVKKDGQDCPVVSDVTKIADIMDFTTTVYRAGDSITTYAFTQKWAGWSVQSGDVLHIQGHYDVETDGQKVDNVYAKIVYLGPGNWIDNFWAHNFVFDSKELGNVDGLVDIKMVVPFYVPTELLKGHDDFLGDDQMAGAAGYHPLLQIRVVYDESPELENLNGDIGINNTFQNYSGPVLYNTTVTAPVLGASVSGIQVSNIGDSSVAVSWDLSSDASWDVIVAPKAEVRNADSYEVFTNVNGIPAYISGLNPGTEYEVFVRAVSDPDTSVTSPLRTVGLFSDAIEFTTTGTASLRSVNVNNNVSIYPNPTTGIITISADKAYAVTVCDLAGRAIMRKSMTSASQELDLSDINNGIYLLQFNDGEQSFAKKFMKQ